MAAGGIQKQAPRSGASNTPTLCCCGLQASWIPSVPLAGATLYDGYQIIFAAPAPDQGVSVFVPKETTTATVTVSAAVNYTVRAAPSGAVSTHVRPCKHRLRTAPCQ